MRSFLVIWAAAVLPQTLDVVAFNSKAEVVTMKGRDGDGVAAYLGREVLRLKSTDGLQVESAKWCSTKLHPFRVCAEPPYSTFTREQVFQHLADVEPTYTETIPRAIGAVAHISTVLSEDYSPERYAQLIAGVTSRGLVRSWELVGLGGVVSCLVGCVSPAAVGGVESVWRHVLDPFVEVVGGEDPLEVFEDRADELGVRLVCARSPALFRLGHPCWESEPFLDGVVRVLSSTPDRDVSVFQVLVEPVDPGSKWPANFHSMELCLKDLHDRSIWGGVRQPRRKPVEELLYAVGIRVASTDAAVVHRLEALLAALHWSGQELPILTERDLLEMLSADQVAAMFVDRQTHKTEMPVCADGLSRLLHLPLRSIHDDALPLRGLHEFPIPMPLRGAGQSGIGHTSTGITITTPKENTQHSFVFFGAPGYGKSNAALHHLLRLINEGQGVGVIDPHGSTAADLLHRIPAEHADRVVWLDPTETTPLSYNPLTAVPGPVGTSVSVLLPAFQAMLAGTFGGRMTFYLGHALSALLVLRRPLADLPLLFSAGTSGAALRRKLLRALDPHAPGMAEVHRFWAHEFDTTRPEAFAPLLHRFAGLLMDATTHTLLSAAENRIDIPAVLRERRILIAHLPIGRLPLHLVSFVGACLLANIMRAAWQAKKTTPFFLAIDEAHFFAGHRLMMQTLDQARKVSLALGLCLQHSKQVPDDLRASVTSIANCLVFRTSADDADRMRRVLDNIPRPGQLTSLRRGQAFLKTAGHVLRITTPPPLPAQPAEIAEAIKASSLATYYATPARPAFPATSPTRHTNDRI